MMTTKNSGYCPRRKKPPMVPKISTVMRSMVVQVMVFETHFRRGALLSFFRYMEFRYVPMPPVIRPQKQPINKILREQIQLTWMRCRLRIICHWMVNKRSMSGSPRKQSRRQTGLIVENTDKIFPMLNLQRIYARMTMPIIGSSFFQFMCVKQGVQAFISM